MSERDLHKAAQRGEPSYIWRAGQQRRLEMIQQAAGRRLEGRVLDNGCGIGAYLSRLSEAATQAHGLEFDTARARRAGEDAPNVVQAAGEALPYPARSFDFVLSHEVLEHVEDDRAAAREIVRVLRPGGRLALFVPNRGYPFETHGVFWRGRYRFGNIPLINYLPSPVRERLAPHVRAYRSSDLARLFDGLPVRTVERTIIFGAYDNLIARFGWPARLLRDAMHLLERTPLRWFGLSHFWVLEKTDR